MLETAQVLANAHIQAVVEEREYLTLVSVLEQCAGQFADQMPPSFCLDLKRLAGTLRDSALVGGKPNQSETPIIRARAVAS